MAHSASAVRSRLSPIGRRTAVVLNPQARQVTPDILAQARALVPAHDLFLSLDLRRAKEIARDIIQHGYDAVLAGGGDGTFTRCVSDLHAAAMQQRRRAPAVGLLRLGTGNGLADTLGIAADQGLEQMIHQARFGTERSIDLLSVEGELTPFAGIGLDAQVLRDYHATQRLAKDCGLPFGGIGGYALSVALRTLPQWLLTRRVEVLAVNMGSPAYRLSPDGQPTGAPIGAGEVLYRGEVALAGASTIPYYGLGLRMFPFADQTPRRFQLRLADCSVPEILAHIPGLFKGTYRSPRIRDFLCDRVSLYTTEPTALQVGGDVRSDKKSITLSIAPAPIRLLS